VICKAAAFSDVGRSFRAGHCWISGWLRSCSGSSSETRKDSDSTSSWSRRVRRGVCLWILHSAEFVRSYNVIASLSWLAVFVGMGVLMWQSSNSNLTTFELQTFSTDSKFDECFKCLVVECVFMEKYLFHDWFYTVSTDSQRAQNSFFLKFNLSHKLHLLNVQHIFLSGDVSHCTNMNMILLTLGSFPPFLLFSFFHWLYLFSSFVHPFPF